FYYLKKKSEFSIIYARDQRSLLIFVLTGNSDKCYLELHTKHTDFVTKFVVKRVKKVIVISKGLQEYYQALTGRQDIQIEPSGVDLEQFKNLPNQNTLKEKFGLPLDKVVYAYIGKYKTMGESKGVKEIIEAFALAYQEVKNIHLLIVGIEERERAEVLEITKNSSLPEHSYTILALDQKIFAEYLMASDVLLMNYPNTEHYAKFMSPTKLFAYLATGKPIISSDLPTIREISGMKSVLYAGSDSISEYSKNIVLTASTYNQLSLEAQQNIVVAEEYSWKKRILKILNDL
ncbi:MAG: glycosyltransferase, partial [Melioribacteraceae bacterium]|nr:glycosyltransferase [Melioribacteraceae bacterium]